MQLDPTVPAASKDALPSLSLMLAYASGRSHLPDGEAGLLAIAMQRYKVTVEEAMDAFWKAYADPFVSQGRIEFRHLWKHIEDTRGTKQKHYTYHEVLREMDKTGLPMDAFEIMDGDNGRPKSLDSDGKFKWRLRK